MGKDYIASQKWVKDLLESEKSRGVSIAPAIKSLTPYASTTWIHAISEDGTITAEKSGASSRLILGPFTGDVAKAWTSLGYTKLTFDINLKPSTVAGEALTFCIRNSANAGTSGSYYLITDTEGKGVTSHVEVPISSITGAQYLQFSGDGTITASNWFISRGE